MNSDYFKKVLLVTSFLLRYPDNDWFKELKEIKEELIETEQGVDVKELLSFIEYAENKDELDLAELYVSTFDFTNRIPLYLTYYTYKEQRDRGMGLLNIKQKYENSGFQMVDNELPDFLPVVLEFSALISKSEILQEYYSVIKEISAKLHKEENPYWKIFSCLLTVLEDNEREYKLTGGVGI